MKIICHQLRHEGVRYIEQDFSAHQLRVMTVEDILSEARARGGVVYISYPDLLNVVGRHLTEESMDASDVEVFYEWKGELRQTSFCRQVRNGIQSRAFQLKDWPYGYFY